MLNRILKYFLDNKLVTVLVLIAFVVGGIITSPFQWENSFLPSDPVAVDAIPDIGENQQIVFTSWDGRSPQDIEDQITYPLTTYLMGLPGVKSIRSSSVFGFSSIYVIFNEDVEFYWSRSRILEKLNALPSGLLPQGVQPSLGPDATALGQVYWYTIEGRDQRGNPTGGWDLHEIRTVQDYYVKYGLNAAEGVSEVASIGGFVKEYQVDVDPDELKAYNLSIADVVNAVRNSNRDAGAKTIEINQAEYFVRGIGYLKSLEDLEKTVVKSVDNVPVKISDIGRVKFGPASRRGALDKDGAEVVGGVVVARHGANPMEVIQNVKDQIEEIAPGLPSKTLADGTESKLTIVPFYDRSGLIHETLGTLEEALSLEILISILVIIVVVYNLRASILISSLLPIAVLMVFIAMRYFNVTANIVALSGIAIAIGTMIDLGIILSENVLKKLEEYKEKASERLSYSKVKEAVYEGSAEVSSAILTAVATTIVSFIPVFTLQAAEGKLFGPLAFTKTFALIAALIITIFILPTLAHWLFGIRLKSKKAGLAVNIVLLAIGLAVAIFGDTLGGLLLLALALAWLIQRLYSKKSTIVRHLPVIVSVLAVVILLAKFWLPLGPTRSIVTNGLFVAIMVGLVLLVFRGVEFYYRPILRWCLDNKGKFILVPILMILLGVNVWLGFATVFSPLEKGAEKIGWNLEETSLWTSLDHTFPGIGEEFMPALDEGSFLLMPTSMPHSGMEYNRKALGQLDMLVSSIPEVELTVGKLGRVESALDPAPISMFENVINYKPEFAVNESGSRLRFQVDGDGKFILQNGDTLSNEEAISDEIKVSQLVADNDGNYFRNWRSHIQSPDDIWNEISKVTKIPGVTSAPKLQPIETRLVMLQTGMRAPMGVKVFGPELETIEEFALEIEKILKDVPQVKSEAVFADRIVGKPYLHININRDEIGRYGLQIEDVQKVIETSIGGMKVTSTVEGRERFPVRVRYPRELRNSPELIEELQVKTPDGGYIPLSQIAELEYVRGPQAIKSENSFLVGYVLFDKIDGLSEVEVVEAAQNSIVEKIDSGALEVPAGVNYTFSGDYENQVRAEKRLSLIVPVVLLVIFLILYFQFRSVSTSLMVFAGIALAFSGGFLMLWLYGQSWFADFSIFGTNMRDLFQMKTVNLSVAVWVGFIALFGIATDDGVLMATYLDQSFKRNRPDTRKETRAAVLEGGQKRIRPAVMTSVTTIIALLPILSSAGRGADIMIPMAIPAFGGMLVAVVTYFLVPVLYSWREEVKLKNE
jgi:Cu(I)/Ag(I) efflux system membrane protein CusA/SilA